MNKLRPIDLGSVSIPADANADAPFDDAVRTATLKVARRRDLSAFSDRELKAELLDRGVTDFSRVTPWLKCALLLVIFAAVVLTNMAVRCQDGELYGFACTIAQ